MSISEGLSHINLTVVDVDRSVRFYTDVFGFEKIFDEQMEGPEFDKVVGFEGAQCRTAGGRVGDVRLEFYTTNWEASTPLVPGIGTVGMSFQVRDAAEAYKRCIELEVPTSGAPNETFGCRIFFVTDPDGVQIEVVEYLPNSPAWGGEGPRRELVALRR